VRFLAIISHPERGESCGYRCQDVTVLSVSCYRSSALLSVGCWVIIHEILYNVSFLNIIYLFLLPYYVKRMGAICTNFITYRQVEVRSVWWVNEMTWIVNKKVNCVGVAYCKKSFCMVHSGRSNTGLDMESLEELLSKVNSSFFSYKLLIQFP
jgi:hypothetical protein